MLAEAKLVMTEALINMAPDIEDDPSLSGEDDIELEELDDILESDSNNLSEETH
jgi:hypothetical protein